MPLDLIWIFLGYCNTGLSCTLRLTMLKCILSMGECSGYDSRAQELYRRRFPNARYSDYPVFFPMHNAFMGYQIPGTAISCTSHGRPRQHNKNVVGTDGWSTISVRNIARYIGISSRTVHNIPITIGVSNICYQGTILKKSNFAKG